MVGVYMCKTYPLRLRLWRCRISCISVVDHQQLELFLFSPPFSVVAAPVALSYSATGILVVYELFYYCPTSTR